MPGYLEVTATRCAGAPILVGRMDCPAATDPLSSFSALLMNRLLLLLLAFPFAASAQEVQADYAPLQAAQSTSGASFALVDSLIIDSGDNAVQFTLGFGFVGGNATPNDEIRPTRYTTRAAFTVPLTRTTPFILTGTRIQYRTQTASGPASNPTRVLIASEDRPIVDVFRGLAPMPEEDSLLTQGQLVTARLPLTTALNPPSPTDGYQTPAQERRLVTFVPAGSTTVPSSLVFQPGETFTIRVQYLGVPFPAGTEAGSRLAANVDSTSRSGQVGFAYSTFDLLTFAGLGVADAVGADGILDQFFIRALSDNSFFPTAGEEGSASNAVALGRPSPNPARGVIELPFALLDGGTARLSVYDALGREVAVVAERAFGAGGQVSRFDASRLAPGVYVVVLEANGERATQRLSVVR